MIKPVRVFVSSTFDDLVEFRKRVRNALRVLGVIDVAMEHLGARTSYPLAECCRLIKEETDVFVGLYAHRYGFIPEGSSISITESEYQAADALPRLVYLLDDETPWKPAWIDRGAKFKALTRFKNDLRAKHVVKEFSSPDQLASFVAADIARELLSRMLPDPKRNERRKEILREALSLAGALGNRDTFTAAADSGRVERFWQLYYGDLIGVENADVEKAMVRLGDLLNRWKSNHAAKPTDFDDSVLELSAALSEQLQQEH